MLRRDEFSEVPVRECECLSRLAAGDVYHVPGHRPLHALRGGEHQLGLALYEDVQGVAPCAQDHIAFIKVPYGQLLGASDDGGFEVVVKIDGEANC